VLAAGCTRAANTIENANQADKRQARRARADVGVAPGSSILISVVDLYYSLWNEQNETER
jgi:hypothetical protein